MSLTCKRILGMWGHADHLCVISSASAPPVIHVLPPDMGPCLLLWHGRSPQGARAEPEVTGRHDSVRAQGRSAAQPGYSTEPHKLCFVIRLQCHMNTHVFSWQKEMPHSGIHILRTQLFPWTEREATSGVSETPFGLMFFKWPAVSDP